ncbi:MAG: hypothetical protein K9M99_11395 [Candidatus Cloacimonetes bacterium]|nr:hypothetical protein [Candidatus Cloacimonadota bacterium]
MKRVLVLLIFVVLLAGVANAETKLSMELWSRWTYLMVDGEDDALQNSLSLNRGLLGIEHKFTDRITGKFAVDFFSREDSEIELSEDEVADVCNNGAGLKIKLAYVDFTDFLWKDATFTFGLMKTYFGTVYDWGYTTIDLNPTDKYGFVSSLDYGMGISGKIPMGMGEYHVAAYNGEGYTKAGSDIDTKMALSADLRLIPVKGITLGGSYYMKPAEGTYLDTLGEYVDYDVDDNRMTGFVRFNMLQGFDLWAQYLTKTSTSQSWVDTLGVVETDLTVNVISIMPIFNIKAYTEVDAELVFRYDMYDDNADIDDDLECSKAYDLMIVGVNYYLLRDANDKAKMWVQANYNMKDYKSEGTTDEPLNDESELKVQLRWKFADLIK